MSTPSPPPHPGHPEACRPPNPRETPWQCTASCMPHSQATRAAAAYLPPWHRPPVYAISIRGQTLDGVPENFLMPVQQEKVDLLPPSAPTPHVEAPTEDIHDTR